ncbi:unnamed protein product, partial [marine sediment metagenome]
VKYNIRRPLTPTEENRLHEIAAIIKKKEAPWNIKYYINNL